MTTRWGVLTLTLCLCSTLVSCERATSQERISIGVSSAGAAVINWYPCDAEVIRGVSLVRPNGNPGDENDEVLWLITSPGLTESRFVVGQTPEGFREAVPLTKQVQPGESLSAIVETDTLTTPIGFSLAELEEGRVLTVFNDLVSEESWRASASSACH
jgi:hypothetical protein